MKFGTVGWGTVERKTHPVVKKNINCKWLIVGGGIAGLSTAYFLHKHGERNIVLIEKNTIGSGSTGRSAGMLVFEPEHEPWKHYVSKYGHATAKLYYDEQQAALKVIKEIIRDNTISCEYEEEDLIVLANTKRERGLILKDFYARKLIKEQAKIIKQNDLHKTFKKSGYLLGEEIRGNISVNPLLFARGFAKALTQKGVQVYEHSKMVHLTSKRAIINDGVVIEFENVITARGVLENNRKIERFLTTICLTQKLTKSELKKTGFHEREMFSDDAGRSFFYGKITKDRRLLLGYGDLKRTGALNPNYTHLPHVRAIERFLKKTFPNQKLIVDYAWSGEYAISKHDLPTIEIEKNHANINGAGTQVVSMVAADFVVSSLLKKKHALKNLFLRK